MISAITENLKLTPFEKAVLSTADINRKCRFDCIETDEGWKTRFRFFDLNGNALFIDIPGEDGFLQKKEAIQAGELLESALPEGYLQFDLSSPVIVTINDKTITFPMSFCANAAQSSMKNEISLSEHFSIIKSISPEIDIVNIDENKRSRVTTQILSMAGRGMREISPAGFSLEVRENLVMQ